MKLVVVVAFLALVLVEASHKTKYGGGYGGGYSGHGGHGSHGGHVGHGNHGGYGHGGYGGHSKGHYYYPCYKPGHFADPKDCSAFIQCDDFGKAHHLWCPKGTKFNPKIGVCDHAYNVYCGPKYGYGYIRKHMPTSTYTSCYKNKHSTGYYPDPYDCNAFIQCDAHGKAYHLYCPKGLYFNSKYGVCDYKKNVYCNQYKSYGHAYYPYHGKKYGGHGYGVCKKGYPGYYADPKYCNAFIQCDEWGIGYHQYCPKGLKFNPKISVCDYPENVYCHNY